MKPLAVLLTEDHVIGWLAMDCTSLALVVKRWNIEFSPCRGEKNPVVSL
ncbi:hypothetical protein [Massilia arenae]|nr:hypothetical protein [Massilia arenae]